MEFSGSCGHRDIITQTVVFFNYCNLGNVNNVQQNISYFVGRLSFLFYFYFFLLYAFCEGMGDQTSNSGTFAIFCFFFSFLVGEANTSHEIGMRDARVEDIEVSSFLIFPPNHSFFLIKC